MNKKNRKIAVIGAGIIGVQIARHLQKAGVDVLLFDKDDPGMATSFGNAGYIAKDEIFPLAHGSVLKSVPRMIFDPLAPLTIRWKELPRLTPWFLKFIWACRRKQAVRGTEALAALQAKAARSWKKDMKEEGLGTLIRENGSLKLYETDWGFKATKPQREYQKKRQIRFRILERDEIGEIAPELKGKVRHGVFFPNGMHTVSPLKLTQKLLENFQKNGGAFIREKVVFLDHGGDDVRVVRTTLNRYPVDGAVLSAGHLSGEFLKGLALKVPIVAERGYHLEVEHKPLKFDMPVGFYERGFYITPMDSGLRLAGTTEFSSPRRQEPENWQRAKLLKKHIQDLMPGVTGKETGKWMGNRPTMPDFLPVLGRCPNLRNLYLAFGHQHLGLTLSAITGEIMADLIVKGKPPLDLSPYDIQRFQ